MSRAAGVVVASGLLLASLPAPHAGAVSEKQLREARESYRRLQDRLNGLAADYAKQQGRLDVVNGKVSATRRGIVQAQADTERLQAQLRERVRIAYRLGGLGFFDFLLSARSFREFSVRAVVLERQASEDEDVLLRLRRTQAALRRRQEDLRRQQRAQREFAGQIRRQTAELTTAFGEAKSTLSQLEAQKGAEDRRRAQDLSRFVQTFRTRPVSDAVGRAVALARCPAAGPHAFSNDWGTPRSGGRRHKGNDVFGPMGSPAVAVVSGRVTRLSSGGSAGLAVYLWGDDGVEYYYFHMNSFTVSSGARVAAGEQIATIGNSGNASGGAPHIHFEVHPGGGGAINPYPSLVRVC